MLQDVKRIKQLENELRQLDISYFIRKGYTLGIKSVKPCKCVHKEVNKWNTQH